MGSNHSSSANLNKNQKKLTKNYSGNNGKFEERDIDNINNKNNKSKKSDKKVQTKFEWNEGGNMVWLTGNFVNWNKFYPMKKTDKGNFELTLSLPYGVYKYKFKVDDEWKYSHQFPYIKEHGVVNNIIDTTLLKKLKEKEEISDSSTSPKEEVTSDEQQQKDKKEKNEKKDKNHNHSPKSPLLTNSPNPPTSPTKSTRTNSNPNNVVNINNIKTIYANYFPLKNEMNTDAPTTPNMYTHFFNLDFNTNQHCIGKKLFLHRVEKNMLSENRAYKDIGNLPHVNV